MEKRIRTTAAFFATLRWELGEQDSRFEAVVKLVKAYREQK